ncbi:MAG: amidohydrolase family protein [Candidatus Jordarchaeum sp.]|uniref:amidohydrolase family protein n=1 Tax=Candidatus Jordarchaeum sp. TaxID=2823881 RepID=UPI00404ACE3B
MIIDAHCHIWEEKMMSVELKEIIYEISKNLGLDPNLTMDGTSDRLIREMDEAGIDRTVILALDYEFAFKGDVTFKDYNDYVANIVKKYPDRLVGYCGIDPRRGKGAIRELERCIQDLELSGVKLWPLTGFYPDNKEYYPFYEKVEELGVPILCHTGAGPPRTYLKYNHPMHVDTVAVDFPKIKIQMAHIGDPWVNEALTVAMKNPNVCFDICGNWAVISKFAPVYLFQTLAQAKMTCGAGKILFGSDWPLFASLISLKEWVENIKKLTRPPPMEILGLPDFSEEEKKLILGENAARILGF